MNYLFIAEKDSVMKAVKLCYENHKSEIRQKVGDIDFTALSGHVCKNYEPNDYPEWGDMAWENINYPIIPDRWEIKPIDGKKKKMINEIQDTVDRYDGVIVGTDSDVEGYGIYYLLEQYLGIETKKTLRFIEQSLTDAEILKSLLSMTDFHTDETHIRSTQSFLLRSRADWLYGMNATMMTSVKMQDLMTIGRVKAPTIKLVYDNSMSIENFKPEEYFVLESDYGSFCSVLTEDEQNPRRFKNKEDVPSVPLSGVVEKRDTERVETHAPMLYDLPSIQAEAGQKYGLNPAQTLEIIQSLYEVHKLISYPRTQCRYISYEKAKELPYMLHNMSVFEELRDIAETISEGDLKRVMGDKKVVNDVEVQKESHDALLPTVNRPILDKLTENEKNICLMIYKRVLAQFMPKLAENKTQMVIRHGSHKFITKGRVIINYGWKILYGKNKETFLPDLKEGDNVLSKEMKIKKRTTTAPKRLTQATLIVAMINIAQTIDDKELKKSLNDSKGIGTPATRAAIILDIIKRGYVNEKKDGLYISDTGKKYIEEIKSLDIISPVFAAIIDTEIKKIQRGEMTYEDVYERVLHGLNKMCGQISRLPSKQNKIAVGCPKCSSELTIERYNYVCHGCGLKISREICGKTIDEDLLCSLIQGNTSQKYSFKKKDKSVFQARLKMEDGELKFDFSSGVDCPVCGRKDITINRGGAFCDCGLKIFRKISGHELTDTEFNSLMTKGMTKVIHDFSGKNGKFSAQIVLSKDNSTGEVKTLFQFDK